MSASLLLQYVVIALAVLLSAWVVGKKQFPGALRKARVALALLLVREGKSVRLQKLGRWIAPEPQSTSDGSCGGCSGCESAPTNKASAGPPSR